VHGDDREILSSTSEMILTLARDHGAWSAFNWISETLSNRIFVEGPYPVVTNDPERTVSELFAANVRDLPDVNK
jgi:hypothetical protein